MNTRCKGVALGMEADRFHAGLVPIVFANKGGRCVVYNLKDLDDAAGAAHCNVVATWREEGWEEGGG